MNMTARRFDIRKIRKLAAQERYAELYFYWREAEQMIASRPPERRRYGRRLKKRVEELYANWFGNRPLQTNLPRMIYSEA